MLDRNSWHTRLYIWTRVSWGEVFGGRGLAAWEIRQTNTCMYIRTLFIWFPLLVLFYGALLTSPFLAVFQPPISMFGTIGLLSISAALVGACLAVGLVVAVAWAFFKLGVAFVKGLGRVFEATSDHFAQTIEECQKPAGTGLCQMIWQFIKDMHEHVCSIHKIN